MIASPAAARSTAGSLRLSRHNRSICYVSDLVDGLMRAMFRPHTAGEVFNLGNTEEHTVLEFAQTIIRLCEATSEILYEPNRIDDPERRRPDITKAQKILGWRPKNKRGSRLASYY